MVHPWEIALDRYILVPGVLHDSVVAAWALHAGGFYSGSKSVALEKEVSTTGPRHAPWVNARTSAR